MRILVIGGTYYLGKAFCELACKDNELTLINRGSRKPVFSYPAHIRNIRADRHELKEAQLEGDFDAVVDFCAYEKGDIATTVNAVSGRIGRYIFISTCDVYKRATGVECDESADFETKDFGGPAGDYILGKAALEEELISCCRENDIRYNSLRPVFIYGPDNYANRENIFFKWIDIAGQVLYPEDATGSFQMVYALDVAKAALKLCESDSLYDRAFNLCGNERLDYDSFCKALEYAVDRPFTRVPVTLKDIELKKIPMPFPLTKEESEYYVSSSADELAVSYIDLKEGLKQTYAKYRESLIFDTIDAYFDENKPQNAERFMLNELERTKAADDAPVSLKLLNELIGYYRQTSEKEKLIKVIDEALELADSSGIKGTNEYATTTLNCANAYRSIGELEKAEKYYDLTDDIYKRNIKDGRLLQDDMLLAGFYNNRSLLYQEKGDHEKARECLEKALPIVKANNAGFETAVTYANLANTEVLAKDFDRAAVTSRIAIRLFKARGLRDPHYAAALSALAACHLNKGDIVGARNIYADALAIVLETIGMNSQYQRLKESIEDCNKRLAGKYTNGLELSKAYYEEYGKAMIKEQFSDYEDKIAIGLVGQGSDCFGYDDPISADHDYGPDFCMWLSDETYEKIGDDLKKAYLELPDSFGGFKRTVTDKGSGRRGVLRISDFYKEFLGTDKYEDIDFRTVEDHALAACVNGEVFRDDEGAFSEMRDKLKKGYPLGIRFLKIAQEAALFSQCGQYNYGRMLKREDELTASLMLADALKHAMKLYHYIMNVFPPHDKWLYKSIGLLDGGRELTLLIDKAQSRFDIADYKETVTDALEEIGTFLAKQLYDACFISETDPYLDHHTDELLFKSQIADLNFEELTDKIVRLEFEAFDKVKNEGGRAYCQDDWPTFSVMRRSQYLTWDHEMLMQYLYDFKREYDLGHNLITEKYGRMMESTAPEKYAEFKDSFPEISEEKKSVIEEIVKVQMGMMEDFSKEHPKVAGNARSLHTYEDDVVDTSYETYLRGEISTYSDKMLQLYGRYVVSFARDGKNVARAIMENTAKLYGYKDITEFESRIE